VIGSLPAEVADVLDRGSLCHVAVDSRHGPHLTPVVYAVAGSRLWLTTARRTVKARTWSQRPRAAGMVRADGLAVSFVGRVHTHDLLDPSTWVPSIAAGPTVPLAAIEFTLRNSRFFAGYAVDARRVPLSWTPPGRVFSEIRLDAMALLDEESGQVIDSWGELDGSVHSHAEFRRVVRGTAPLDAVPRDTRSRLGTGGPAALAVQGPEETVVVPCHWLEDGASIYAALSSGTLALAGGGPTVRVALTIDRASQWRASAMAGVIVQGQSDVHVLERLRSGRHSAEALVRRAGASVSGAALLRIQPERLVWWRGWASGTVRPA